MSTVTAATSVPIIREISDQVTLFKPPIREFVLFNARKKSVEVQYVGNLMTIPAVNVFNKDRSDYDADGDPIPGSYVVRDLYQMNSESGDEDLIFDAARAIAHILGIQKSGRDQAAVATSAFAVSGLSVLPLHADKDLIAAIRESGGQLAYLAEVENARVFVEGISERNAKRKSNGLDPIPGGVEYTRARAVLVEYERLVAIDVKREAKVAEDPIADATIDEEAEIAAIARALALELAEKHAAGKTIDKMELLKELLNDPAVRAKAQKEYRWRKRGRDPIPPEQLEAAAAAGLNVSDIESGDDKDAEER